MSGLPVFFTALAEEDFDQMGKAILRILHAAPRLVTRTRIKRS